jgi:uncharacterized protein YcaQ
VLEPDIYHRWIVERRVQAVGLLRSGADQSFWSSCGDAPRRTKALNELVEIGRLTPVRLEEERATYHVHSSLLKLLNDRSPHLDMLFLGPLDGALWDRKMVQRIFDFDYVWEVYKPEGARKWGYYVLPVLYGDRFVGRFEARSEGTVCVFIRWWWEDGVMLTKDLAASLASVTLRFMHYLRADSVRVGEGVDTWTRNAIKWGLSGAALGPL